MCLHGKSYERRIRLNAVIGVIYEVLVAQGRREPLEAQGQNWELRSPARKEIFTYIIN